MSQLKKMRTAVKKVNIKNESIQKFSNEVEAKVCVNVSPQLLAHLTDRFRLIKCKKLKKLNQLN